MYFRQFHDTTSAAMSYLIADSSSGVAVAIDPTPDPCRGLVLKALLAERGFAVRSCDSFPGLGPGWVRLAVRDASTSRQVAAALGGLR